MANWKTRLEFKELWKEHKDGSKSIQDVAKSVAEALKVHPEYEADAELQDVTNQFEEFASDTSATADDFDGILEDLYDWADAARCWVATF